jgi:hypothetical protein
MAVDKISVNRAPVLTLWVSVVAEHLGYARDEALTLGKAVAGLNAQSKGRRLGIYKPGREKERKPPARKPGESFAVEILGRQVPVVETKSGVRALAKDKAIEPASVEGYLERKFGDNLADVRKAMAALAASFDADTLADRAYSLYETFRPDIPSGRRGWGAKGDLSLSLIRSLGKK